MGELPLTAFQNACNRRGTMHRSGSHARLLAAVTLLSVLCLGTVAHLWHHLTDPNCGPEGRHGTQPCATCSALHSVPVLAHAQSPEPPVVRTVSEVLAPESGRPATSHRTTGAARAPPQT